MKLAILAILAVMAPASAWADGAVIAPGEPGYSRAPPAYSHLEPRVIEKHTRIVEPAPPPVVYSPQPLYEAPINWYPECGWWNDFCHGPPIFFDDDDFRFGFHRDHGFREHREFGEFHEHGHEFGGHFGGGGFHGGFGGHVGGGHHR